MTLTANLERYVTDFGAEPLTSGERYMIRKRISDLYRQAKAHEDRHTENDRVIALRIRAEADDLNEELRRAK